MYNWSGHARPPGRRSTKVGADRSVLLCCGPATGDAGRKLKCCKTEMLCWHLQWSLQSPHRPVLLLVRWRRDYRLHAGRHCPGLYTAGTRDIIDRSGGAECPLATVHPTPLHRLMGNSDTNIYLVPARPSPCLPRPPYLDNGVWCPLCYPGPVSSPHNPGKLDTSTRHYSRVAPRLTPPPTDGPAVPLFSDPITSPLRYLPSMVNN